MQDKRKKNKKQTKVRDLKPKKDAKGGGPQHQQGGLKIMGPNQQK